MELFQERQPLDMRVLSGGRAEDFAIEVVQSGKQRDGAVADVIVCARPHMADP